MLHSVRTLSRSRLKGFIPALAVLAALIVAVPALGQNSSTESHVAITPAARTALGLETAPVSMASHANGLHLTGRLIMAPDAMVQIFAPARMTLRESLVLTGQAVDTDDVLQRYYSPELIALQAELAILDQEAEHQRERADRAALLLDAGLATREEFHELRLQSRAAAGRRDALLARFDGFSIRARSADVEVLAPRPGQVISALTEPGMVVGEGEILLSIALAPVMRIRLDVPEEIAMRLEAGDPVRVPGAAGSGEIIAVGAELSPDSRLVPVFASAPDALSGRRPGGLVEVDVQPGAAAGAILVPARALVRVAGGDVVFVDLGDHIQMVPVRLVSRTRDQALLEPGDLRTDQRVVVSGTAALKNIFESE